MSDSCTIRIERLANGYEVEITDPKIVAQNSKPNSTYKDPCVGYAFKDVKEVLAFLQKNLEKAMPMGEYESSFNAALEDDDE